MIEKGQLQGKEIAFRLLGSNLVNVGSVQLVEEDGFWIESPQLLGQLQRDAAWGPALKTIQEPVLFVPISSLMFLIVSKT